MGRGVIEYSRWGVGQGALERGAGQGILQRHLDKHIFHQLMPDGGLRQVHYPHLMQS